MVRIQQSSEAMAAGDRPIARELIFSMLRE
jgi:hypothetical protein